MRLRWSEPTPMMRALAMRRRHTASISDGRRDRTVTRGPCPRRAAKVDKGGQSEHSACFLKN